MRDPFTVAQCDGYGNAALIVSSMVPPRGWTGPRRRTAPDPLEAFRSRKPADRGCATGGSPGVAASSSRRPASPRSACYSYHLLREIDGLAWHSFGVKTALSRVNNRPLAEPVLSA